MVSSQKLNGRDSLVILSAALAYGILVYAILPGWTVALNDDFSYLRSIVETIQHGRLWTDDFLEPWALSLIALSTGIFKITGSFFCATICLQTLMGAASFWLVCQIAGDCGYRPLATIGIAAALLTFPTVLWKQVEYTALVIYLPSLLAALWFAGRNRWTLFFVAWATAVASRPSALAWLVIPAVAGVEAAVSARKLAKAKLPFAVVALSMGFFFAVRGYANETHAQRFITNQIFSNANLPTFWANLKIGVWILAVATGCSSLFCRGLRWQPTPRAGVAGYVGGIIVATGLLATLPLVANSIPLAFEHPFFENVWAVGYLRGLVVVAAVGWLTAIPSLRLPFLYAAFAALFLASLRTELWDYYLIDVAVLAFFSVRSPVAPTESSARSRWVRWTQLGVVSTLLLGAIVLQIAATGPLKRRVDNYAGMNSVLEKALRAGWMKPSELSFAPFGFVAWHLLPYYLAHEGKDSADLGGFGIYVDHDAVDVQIDTVSRAEAKAPLRNGGKDAAHPFSEIHPRGWFGYARFTLEHSSKQKPADTAINWKEYDYPVFPLNDSEWRELVHNGK